LARVVNTISLIGVLPHFHFKTDTKFSRRVIKSKTENRNVKIQDLTAKLEPTLFPPLRDVGSSHDSSICTAQESREEEV